MNESMLEREVDVTAPTCSKLWDPIIPKIACTIKPRPAGISFPKKKWFYYFSIFYYFRLLLLTSVKTSTASPQVTDTLPLIIFMTGTDTRHPSTLHIPSLTSHSSLAEEDWHMPIESFQYFIILFRVNQVFTFYHFIVTVNIVNNFFGYLYHYQSQSDSFNKSH